MKVQEIQQTSIQGQSSMVSSSNTHTNLIPKGIVDSNMHERTNVHNVVTTVEQDHGHANSQACCN